MIVSSHTTGHWLRSTCCSVVGSFKVQHGQTVSASFDCQQYKQYKQYSWCKCKFVRQEVKCVLGTATDSMINRMKT